MQAVEIRKLEMGSSQYEEGFKLRDDILKRPEGERLSLSSLPYEAVSSHLGAYCQERLIGALTWYCQENIAVVKHLVVTGEFRGIGVGKRLLMSAEDEMKEAGLAICRLKARVSARGFYEKLGYHSEGEMIPGTVPHVMMEKNLISTEN